ncbi:MAG: hypothetical protein LAN59_07920 [Acidobacteriia bacterium]|nr:hypothetical protein [Terriglobia bacterium]
MAIASANTQRRSARLIASFPVRAQGTNGEGRKFRERSHTIVVNVQGGLLYLQEKLEIGTEIVLVNPATEEEQECRVVYVGESSDKGTRIGIEFLSPSPHFWGVDFVSQGPPPHVPGTLH